MATLREKFKWKGQVAMADILAEEVTMLIASMGSYQNAVAAHCPDGGKLLVATIERWRNDLAATGTPSRMISAAPPR